MSITQNSKIRRITDSTLVVGADIAKKVHVTRLANSMKFSEQEIPVLGNWLYIKNVVFEGVDKDFFTLHYSKQIYEYGIQCRDMIRLALNCKKL